MKKDLVVNKVRRQVYIVNNLKINMLINSNILSSKKIMLDFVIKSLTIDSCCDIIAFIKVIFLREKIYKIVHVYDVTIVLFYLNIIVLIYLRDKCKAKLSKNCDLIFMSTKLSNCFKSNRDILNYIIDVSICAI